MTRYGKKDTQWTKHDMKKEWIAYLLIGLVWISIFIVRCSRNPFSNNNDDHHFAIYFLADTTLKMNDVIENVINGNLDDIKLQSEPWLSEKDIDFYDWSSHCIYLKKDKTYFIPGWQKKDRFNVFPTEWADRPFVVEANGKKCYLGYFSRVELSMDMWIAPMVGDVGLNSLYPQDVIFIDWSWLYHEYPQNNPAVKNALLDAGLYHGGISITFDTTDVNTLRMIENADTSTISYKFTIANNDEDDLYIIDSDKMGSGLFHWFTNGLTFQNIETKKIYEPRWRKHIQLPSLDYWSTDWFIKLESGHSIQRTVILKGYPHFPTGEYLFELRYNGQIRAMEKEERELSDGRYWLGPTRSNVLVWNFKADDDSLLAKNCVVGKYTHSPDKYLRIGSTQQQFEFIRR